jgi:hypothetical protein
MTMPGSLRYLPINVPCDFLFAGFRTVPQLEMGQFMGKGRRQFILGSGRFHFAKTGTFRHIKAIITPICAATTSNIGVI